MAHHRITRDALGSLTKLGQGGQGIVYQAPKVKAKFAHAMVFKEYKPQARGDVSFEALAAMPTLVEDTLSYDDGDGLISIAAWPCAIVENGTGPVGFVMPAIPAPFHIDLTTVKGISRTTAEFQHLLNPPSVLMARGITITDKQRYQLVREVAKGLAFFHRIRVCVGDISPKNVLFSLNPHPAVYFLDCDAMRVNGVSALPQMETPEWEVPAGEEPATTYSDTYKLGLLALRLLAGDQHTKNPADLPTTTPKPLRQLITDTLTKKPDQRPPPEAWTYLLGDLIDETQQNATGPLVAPPEPALPKHPTEPTPVVRTPPQTTPHTTTIAVPASAVAGPRQKWIRKHTAVLAAAIVGVSVLVGILLIQQRNHPPLAVFDGTFTATYGVQTNFSGQNPGPETQTTLTWVVRSACDGDRCVAAATTKNRKGGEVSAVYDYVDGRWLAVYTRNDVDCGGTDIWFAVSLQATSVGSLAGELRWAHPDGTECNGIRPVTYSRIGDPDPSIATLDPTSAEAYKVSPAQALRGAYHFTQEYENAGSKYEYDYRVETFCLRTGERCLTVFFEPNGVQSFIFGGSSWARTRNIDTLCTNGQPTKQELSMTLRLPGSRQIPITMLRGSGVAKTLMECPGTLNFDLTVTRTGD